MRRFAIVLLSVASVCSTPAAFAQAMTPAPASATASAPAQSPEPQVVREAPAVAIAAQEPNMKVTEGSGGKSTSSLIINAPLSSDFTLGDRKAPIIMVEYASLSCPHCAHFSETTLPDLQKKYIDTGKMLYILRPFPLNEPALKGAMLLDCVGQQDNSKYYTFAKVLFDAQAKWAFDGNYMAGLETIANVGGLSREQFQGCVNNTEREMRILKIKKDANDELKVPHTPYIFIAGEVYNGDRDTIPVSKFIDSKLAEDAQKGPVSHALDKLDRVKPAF